MITLQPITSDNWIDCIGLAPTAEQVRIGFVAPNCVSLMQAHFEPWWHYDAANPVMAHLCTQLGFQPTGRIIDGEIEARFA